MGAFESGKNRWLITVIIICIFVTFCSSYANASDSEDRLFVDIFKGYNSLIQPIRNSNDTPTIVRIALQLVLLIDVDEKDQIMHSNIWLTLKWKDYQMVWDPKLYGNIKEIRVAPDKVWLPDIVLFNNADGNYEVSYMCNVVIFGSWTYDENEVILDFDQAESMDLSEYTTSSTWDIIDAPAVLTKKRSLIEFQLRIRRKTLFYTVVLILPTVFMAFLSLSVFILPTDSAEKMSLTINVLLSIVVFLLLVSKILPPTSLTIPLLAKYLLLTFVLNIITTLVSVIVINIYFRGPTTHRMPKWVHTVFLVIMPKLLCMQRPKQNIRKPVLTTSQNGLMSLPGVGTFSRNPAHHHPYCSSTGDTNASPNQPVQNLPPQDHLSSDAVQAIDAVEYITDYLKEEQEEKAFRDDWKYVAMVIDRVLLYVFLGITVGGTIGILGSSPYVLDHVDQQKILKELIYRYKHAGDL
uniref:Uncharacterized protein n=1 Tax=Panagrolaimus sp. ES5 TaxID=591445 RepID=A0AC34GN31_9BILA